jgi:hypothetical protein
MVIGTQGKSSGPGKIKKTGTMKSQTSTGPTPITSRTTSSGPTPPTSPSTYINIEAVGPISKKDIDHVIEANQHYTVYRTDGINWNTLPFPAKGKGVTAPLQIGNLPRYKPIPRIPSPMKTPPEEVIYLITFTEMPTRKLGSESDEEYKRKKYNWYKQHDRLLFNGTTETTFDEVFDAIEDGVKRELRGNFGISLLYQTGPLRGDCIMMKDDKIVKPKHKIYHQFNQILHTSLLPWLTHPNGKPVFSVNFTYYKKPRVKQGMAINETELACDGFLDISRRVRYKWDDTYDYNLNTVIKKIPF